MSNCSVVRTLKSNDWYRTLFRPKILPGCLIGAEGKRQQHGGHEPDNCW
jgi:hypothetical protein